MNIQGLDPKVVRVAGAVVGAAIGGGVAYLLTPYDEDEFDEIVDQHSELFEESDVDVEVNVKSKEK